jgi:hypothetical protein
MTLAEYKLLENEFKKQDRPIRVFLKTKDVTIHQYYYWMRKSKDLDEPFVPCEGQFGDGKIFVTPVTETYTISNGKKEI